MEAPTCPDCSSLSTQTVKMLCLSMTTTSRTVGVGIGAAGQFAAGTSTNRNIPQLVAKFNPGPSPHVHGCGWFSLGCVSLFFALIFRAMSGDWDGPSVFFGLLAIGSLIGPAFESKSIRETTRLAWQERAKMYELGWICQQCGKAWIPPTASTTDI